MLDYTKEINACLLRFKQGDTSQFDELMNLTTNHLVGVAKYYLSDKNNAEDVVTEAFVHVFKYIKSYMPGQNGYAWLCKITQNMAYSFNKKQGKAKEAEMKYVNNQSNDYLQAVLDDISFFSYLDTLDELNRTIAYHRFYLGETEQVIGDLLHVSKVAICKRIQKICKTIEKIRETG